MHLVPTTAGQPAAATKALDILGRLEMTLRNTDAVLERRVIGRASSHQTTTGRVVRESIPNASFPIAFRSYATVAREAASLLTDTQLPAREWLAGRFEQHARTLDSQADQLQGMIAVGSSFGNSWGSALDDVIADTERAVTALAT